MGKTMSYDKRIFAGFLMVEIIVALTVLAMLLAAVAFSLNGMAKFNRYQLIRQQCIAAAQAELDSMTATGESISNEEFSRLWPELKVSVKETEGTDQWEGMKLVEVIASGKYLRKQVTIELSRYIRRNAPSVEGK
jgi:type II secretory pathway pseudopilin PulG